MNLIIKELMVKAGYACPEMAPRAQKLVNLIIQECRDAISTKDTKLVAVPCDTLICKHFGVKE